MRLATYKTGIQHFETNITSVGGASAPGSTNVLETETGARTTTGAEQVTKDSATTGEVCNIGDIVKYVHLFAWCAPRSEATSANGRNAVLEWAFLMVKESDTVVPITNTGTLTIGNICTNMYRNECIYTGMIPIGNAQGNTMEAMIKVPKFKQKIRIGDEWRFVTGIRDVKVTATDTDSHRLVKSWTYKSYS